MGSVEKYTRRLSSLERQVRDIATQPRLAYSSIDNGTLTLTDIHGDVSGYVGRQFDGTVGVAAVAGPPPPSPTMPLLTPVPGGLRVYWDGTFVDDSPTMMNWKRVTFHAVTDVDDFDAVDPAQIVGTISIATGGEVTVSLPPIEHFVCAVAWSDAGKFSVESDFAFATPISIVDPVLWQQHEDALDNLNNVALPALDAELTVLQDTTIPALQAELDASQVDIAALEDTTLPALQAELDASQVDIANALSRVGATEVDIAALENTTLPALQAELDASQVDIANRVRVIFNASQPTGLTASDRVVWYDSDNGNSASYWNGTGWGPYTLGAGAITDGAITTAKVANLAIDTAKLASNAVDASKIADGAVGTLELAADAVTEAKLAVDAISSRVVAAGAITETKVASDAITTPKIATGAVTADEVAANAIVAGKIAANAVTATTIAADAVTAAKIQAGAVTAGKIAADAVTATEIAANAVTANEILAGAVTTAKIAANAVTANEIAANAVTANKLSVIMGGGNLFRNSGFDDTADMPGVANGATVASDTAQAYRGARSLKVTLSTFASQTGVNLSPLMEPLKPNTKYVLSVRFYNPTTNGVASGVQLSVQGTVPGTLAAATGTSYNTTRDGWVRLSVGFTSGTNAIPAPALYVLANNTTAGQVFWVDTIQLEEGEVLTAYAPKVDEILPGTIQASMIAADTITASQIATDAITATEIAANAVTATEIATDAVIAAKIQAGAVTAGKIAADAVTATTIAAGAITTAKIAANAVTANEIAANAVTASEIQAGAVTAGKIAADAVTATEIAANAITSAKINAGAVVAGKIAADAVTATEIAADAVTANEIATGTITANEIAADTITGNQIAAGSITADEIDAEVLRAGFVLTGAIQVGQATWNPTEGLIIPQPNGSRIHLPADGVTPATLGGHANLDSATVKGNFNLLGVTNKVSGELELSDGIVEPTLAPSCYPGWPSFYASGLDPLNASWRIYAGMTAHPTDPNLFAVGLNYGGAGIRYINRLTGEWAGDNGGSYFSDYIIDGLGFHSGHYYTYGQDQTRGGYWIYKIRVSDWVKVAEVQVSTDSFRHWDTRPTFAVEPGTGECFVTYVRRGTSLLNTQRYFSDLSFNYHNVDFHDLGVACNLDGANLTTSDEGVWTLYVVLEETRHVAAFPVSTLVYDSAMSFQSAANSQTRGIMYHSGIGRFISYSKQATLYTYSSHKRDQAVTASYTWYDNDGTVRETREGPVASYTIPKRSQLIVETGTPPDSGNTDPLQVDKANKVGIYVGIGAGARKRQVYLGVDGSGVSERHAWIDVITTNLNSPPASNTFIGGNTSTGRIVSGAESGGSPILEISGDGSIKAGQIEVNGIDIAIRSDAAVTLDANVTGGSRAYRDGPIANVSFGIKNTVQWPNYSWYLGTVPSGYRPAYTVEMTLHDPNGVAYPCLLLTDGGIQARKVIPDETDLLGHITYRRA